jgi:hypothetical protein
MSASIQLSEDEEMTIVVRPLLWPEPKNWSYCDGYKRFGIWFVKYGVIKKIKNN